MPRRPRHASAGYVYHVLNRGVARATIFEHADDYLAFERVLHEAQEWLPMRLLSFCLMPNHWHLIVSPLKDGDLSEWMRWLTLTHTQRWHGKHQTRGTGPLYQGRFKSFPIEEDEHFLIVCRYVERNALRAKLVRQAENWRWSSLWQRLHKESTLPLAPWPLARPRNWLGHVNEPQTESELEALRRSVVRGTPFGNDGWVASTARRLGLQSTLRSRGRPRKQPDGK
jgi:putative transposase